MMSLFSSYHCDVGCREEVDRVGFFLIFINNSEGPNHSVMISLFLPRSLSLSVSLFLRAQTPSSKFLAFYF
jgi:hypothetical protein